MNSKALHKALFCMLTILFISLPSMAQNNEKAIYGTYPGTMSTKITKNGSTFDGATKNVSFVLSSGDNGTVSIIMKNYSVAGHGLKDISLPNNIITKTDKGWEITQKNVVQGGYMTEDNVYEVSLSFRISDAIISHDGTCSLSLIVKYSGANIKHQFRGNKIITGIKNVNAVQNVSKDIYDLQGRRVEKPGHGIYIVGGKKVMF